MPTEIHFGQTAAIEVDEDYEEVRSRVGRVRNEPLELHRQGQPILVNWEQVVYVEPGPQPVRSEDALRSAAAS